MNISIHQILVHIGDKVYKSCSVCKKQKECSCFSYNYKSFSKYRSGCKDCLNAKLRSYRKKQVITISMKEKSRLTTIKHRLNNKEYRDRSNKNSIERYKFYKKTLHDSYIKQLLVKRTILSAYDLPQSLVDLKRKEVSITRKFIK